ncbi:hypothetical protein H311_03050, partial [Anncaliia algerae PRA109]
AFNLNCSIDISLPNESSHHKSICNLHSISHNITIKYTYKIIIEVLYILLSNKCNEFIEVALKEEFSKIKEKWKIKKPDKITHKHCK